MHRWLEGYDFNLPLLDAANDPALSEARRTLAGVGLREGLDGGYYEAQALADAVLAVAQAENRGASGAAAQAMSALDALLAGDAHGYQRGLYVVVAALPAADAAADLCWITDVMRQRADMYQLLAAAGVTAAPRSA
jgi:hypothetical protein